MTEHTRHLTHNQQRFVRNFDAHDFAVSLGIERAWMIYNGTLTRAMQWVDNDPAGNPVLRTADDIKVHGLMQNVSTGDKAIDGSIVPDYSNPPARNPCMAMGMLANTPDMYGPGISLTLQSFSILRAVQV